MAWLRLLIAAELLDEPWRSVASVARASGYANAYSINHSLKEFVGLTPRELRQLGAFDTVAHRFARELFDLREASRGSSRGTGKWLH
jgi:AraC-like DNA-binding protein